ncbi:uncharacterized protein SPPG_08811 [Spizellomyces punctatus DAOM BR117]|uniref:Uncharacterized protein n=1 Tax=Spizellomyces punctatus (strain DAOM BR117) TaxID=645134 RepID=A0A0L0HT64_SPIPD|nr:uncharacterized protein SPPG_08811 [Spizellomyces punctatus DAOM BR117]KND04287.1 hypothetical protein SPPG_08811 [Spizellomyces punctatus DAOM BR117]|eukprot:XP_016612326.1 hypothetical protein SPPG_08811 [Spizellomyces punctatus DAOM BR117]
MDGNVPYPPYSLPLTSFPNQEDMEGEWEAPLNQKETEEQLKALLENVQHTAEVSPPERRLQTPPDLRIELLEHQKLGLEWMLKMEQGTNKGGILADDMGLGKTIQSLSVIVSNRGGRSQPTLIIAPVSLILQWEKEIEEKTKPNTLRVLIYYGSKRERSHNRIRTYDVVITSYSLVALEWPKSQKKEKEQLEMLMDRNARQAMDDAEYEKERQDDESEEITLRKSAGPLFKIKWWRVILDEAHVIKNKRTRGAKACQQLDAQYRWCLTGTPIQNNIGELYSLVFFLKIKPFCEWTEFKKKIEQPFKRGRHKRAIARVQGLLQAICLRRTKKCMIDGRPIIQLPERNTNHIEIDFTAAERDFYRSLEDRVQLRFNAYLRAGTVMKNYTNILVLLLRLRQACCHPSLVAKDFEAADPADAMAATTQEDHYHQIFARFDPEVKNRLLAADFDQECIICLDAMTDAVFSSCGHAFCRECLTEAVTSQARLAGDRRCPTCRAAIDLDALVPVSFYRKTFRREEGTNGKGKEPAKNGLFDEDFDNDFFAPDPEEKGLTSSKIEEMLRILDQAKKEAPEDKTIVFSQFTTMLDLCEDALRRKGYKFTRYDGTMSADQRDASLNKLKNGAQTTILLVSLKCGSLGLNLTCANRVILLDAWWNPAVENQAIDRVHRFGQLKAVHVHRITIKKTIENRILALQDKKQQLFEAALGEGTSAFGKGGRLTLGDLMTLFNVEVDSD